MTDQALLEIAGRARGPAYAPYSRFRVGAALLCEDGTVFSGCNVENAAYGACICAEQTALVKAISEGRRSFVRIAVRGSNGKPCWPCGTCRQILSEFSPQMVVVTDGREKKPVSTPLVALLPMSFGPDDLEMP